MDKDKNTDNIVIEYNENKEKKKSNNSLNCHAGTHKY
jgi:hypothetical protein